MRKTHALGLILWRGGLLLAGGYVLFIAAKKILFYSHLFGLEIPDTVEVGLGLVIAGVVLIFISVIAERVQDARREKEEAHEL